MSINLSQSPIKIKNYHELSTQIKYFSSVISEFNSITSINTVDRSFQNQNQLYHLNHLTKIVAAQFFLRELIKRRTRSAFLKIKKRSLKTQMSERQVMGKEEWKNIMTEEGFIQLDYVIKSDAQKNKVMGFEFIKNTYKQYKRKKQKRLRTATSILSKLFNNRNKRDKQTGFNQIVNYASSLPSFKFALKFLDKILLDCFNRRKKQAFQSIIRCALSKFRQKSVESTTRRESSQHIYVIKPRSHSRKKSQTIFVKVPIVSDRVYLKQLNVSSRKTHRRSTSSFKESVKYSSCSYCYNYQKCKYCQILKFLDN